MLSRNVLCRTINGCSSCWRFVFWFHLCTLLALAADAAPIMEAHELALGEWQLSVKGLFTSAPVFPILAELGADESTRTQQNNGRQQLSNPLHRRRRPVDLECRLTLHGDGTFTIVACGKPEGDRKSSAWPLRGRWKVLSNPYCITDRSYDQLMLESYPLLLAKRRGERTDGEVAEDNSKSQMLRLIFHCRMWGRYGSSEGGLLAKWRPNYARGRMTHGTLLWDVIQKPEERLKTKSKKILTRPRTIVASFSAFRPATYLQSTEQGEESQEFFGY
jgi:hypothetical protein